MKSADGAWLGTRRRRREPATETGEAPRPSGESPQDLQRMVRLPRPEASPFRQVAQRLLAAFAVLWLTVLVVYLDREGYEDGVDGTVSFLDCVYYTTVTLSTTGYGDIAPVSETARLLNVLIITPLRVLFLIILIGTTLEALTDRTREQWRHSRWRSALRDHTVVVGFGTKGRSAIQSLLSTGLSRENVVIIDPNHHVVNAANAEGFAGIMGDGSRSEVLRRAEAQRAQQIVIAPQRDDTAVLVTLTARQLNPRIKIVAAVREEENAPLLRQSGADGVITSASAAGRLLGLATTSQYASEVLEDLIHQGRGLDLKERPATKAEAGRSPRECADLVVSVVRGHRVLSFDDPEVATLQLTDRLIVIKRASYPRGGSGPGTTGVQSPPPR